MRCLAAMYPVVQFRVVEDRAAAVAPELLAMVREMEEDIARETKNIGNDPANDPMCRKARALLARIDGDT